MDVYKLLACSAHRAYTNVLSCSNSPKQEEYFKRYSEPVVGDMVLETSSLTRVDSHFESIGRLKSITWEELPFEDWPEDEEKPTEKVYNIELLDGSQYRWTNASFIKIPEEFFD